MEGHGFYEQLALWSEVVGGIAFIVVAYLLFRKYMLPAVSAGEKAKNADLELAQQRRERLRAEAATAQAEVSAAESDARGIGERAANDARNERERILHEARAEGQRLMQNAEGELARGRIAARDRLRIELIEKALLRAREIATQRVDDATNVRLVERTVDQITARRG